MFRNVLTALLLLLLQCNFARGVVAGTEVVTISQIQNLGAGTSADQEGRSPVIIVSQEPPPEDNEHIRQAVCLLVQVQYSSMSLAEFLWGVTELRLSPLKQKQQPSFDGNLISVSTVSPESCHIGNRANTSVLCRGSWNLRPCTLSIPWEEVACVCMASSSHTLKFTSSLENVNSGESDMFEINSKLVWSRLSAMCTSIGLLLMASAQPLSQMRAMHVILGGLAGAGLAHVGAMIAIAAVPGAVMALPWVAALSAYRLGLCEALAMLVCGYLYTFALALSLLYLYTQHFNYIQAVYLFIVFHAALAGALRVDSLQGGGFLGQGLGRGSPLTPFPGATDMLQKSVFFSLLLVGATVVLATTNTKLQATLLQQQDFPPWTALPLAALPVFFLVGLEIHTGALSSLLKALLKTPCFVSDMSAAALEWLRIALGFTIPGRARSQRYNLRTVRRVFYSHASAYQHRHSAAALLKGKDLVALLRRFWRYALYKVAGGDAPVLADPWLDEDGVDADPTWLPHMADDGSRGQRTAGGEEDGRRSRQVGLVQGSGGDEIEEVEWTTEDEEDAEVDMMIDEENERAEAEVAEGALEWEWLGKENLTPGEALAAQSCSICLAARKNVAFGCGHQTCRACAQSLACCPICRKNISVVIPLFY